MKMVINTKKTGELMKLTFQLLTGELIYVTCSHIISREGTSNTYTAFFEKSGQRLSEEDSIPYLRFISKVIEAKFFLDPVWVDITLDQIHFWSDTGSLLYCLPDDALEKVKEITITVDGFEETMSLEKYNKLAKFVRQKDLLQNMTNAMENQLAESCYANVQQYVYAEMVSCPAVVAEEWSWVEEYSGEDELRTLSGIIEKRGGMAWYTMVSNKGTSNECENLVLLMCSVAEMWQENIRERDNGTEMPLEEDDIILTDSNGDAVDLFFVDEIIFSEKETLA